MIQLVDAMFIVNDEPIVTIPNTISFTEGLGEQDMRAGSVGNGKVEAIYSNDITTKFSMIKADIPSTVDNIALARKWKLNKNNNVVQIISQSIEGNVTRTFSRAALTSNYEVMISTDGAISLEFKSLPAV
jgi:hypothetical protein